MKSTIITVIITALTVTTIGLGTKLALNSKSSAAAPESAPISAIATPVASTPTAAEKPKITKVTPQYTTVQVPTKKCQMVNQTQMVENTNKSGTMGGVIGGTTGAVAGGVIGKQIGGNTAGTLIGGAVGLIGGAVAGNQIQKATQPNQVAQTNQVQQCAQATKQVKKITGYNVAYMYQGQPGSVFMKNKPSGQYLPLNAIN